nr:unnamed protein product [Digitaria exilis]
MGGVVESAPSWATVYTVQDAGHGAITHIHPPRRPLDPDQHGACACVRAPHTGVASHDGGGATATPPEPGVHASQSPSRPWTGCSLLCTPRPASRQAPFSSQSTNQQSSDFTVSSNETAERA